MAKSRSDVSCPVAEVKCTLRQDIFILGKILYLAKIAKIETTQVWDGQPDLNFEKMKAILTLRIVGS